MKKPTQESYAARAAVFKALGNPARLLMVNALAQGELCVCELTELSGLDVSTVSKHLSVLREVGIVEFRKEGTSAYYRLALQCVPNFIACVDRHLKQGALARVATLG